MYYARLQCGRCYLLNWEATNGVAGAGACCRSGAARSRGWAPVFAPAPKRNETRRSITFVAARLTGGQICNACAYHPATRRRRHHHHARPASRHRCRRVTHPSHDLAPHGVLTSCLCPVRQDAARAHGANDVRTASLAPMQQMHTYAQCILSRA